jgi:tetratricopeptide (TPR) repeat protein
MGQRPNDLTPHQSLHHYWGAELRALRVARGLSLAELGHQLHCDPSYLAKIERAERPIPATLAQSCDHVLETQGMLVRLHTLAESDRDLTANPGSQMPDHVASSTGSLAGGATFPAAPDTGPDTGEEIVVPARTSDGRVVYVSVPRRVFLHGLGSVAVGLATTPAAASPHRVTLPADVNPVEHFQHLRQVLIENDNLFGPRQVIPVVREQITIIQQLRSSWRGVDQRELLRVQAQYSELCGWLYQDAGEHQLAESWIDRAFGLSHMAGDQDLTVFLLTCKAHLAGDMRVAADTIGAGEHALHTAPPRSRLAVIAASRAAHGYALSGDYAATERAHDHARELLNTVDDDPDSPYGSWLNDRWLALGEAQDWTILGNCHGAAQIFQNALADYPGRYLRARGVCLARTALAHADDHEVEQAATLGLDALPIGVETGSARILTALAQLNDKFTPWNAVPAVADFRTAMKDTLSRQA